MGTALSRLHEVDNKTEMNTPTPVTPQSRLLNIDPRSPSLEITRTPIEVPRTPLTLDSTNIKVRDNEQTQDVCNGLDPRSPTTEFHRSPIVIKEPVLKLHNKILDNARMPLVSITPIKPKRRFDESGRSIIHVNSPKLLASELKAVKCPENKCNSVVGLLETNIDYIETDLDEVIQKKALMKTNVEHNLEIDLEGIAELFVTNENSNEETEISSIVDMKRVDELDRKLTNIIYEDKQLNNTPKIHKVSGTRTPLGDHNFNSPQQKPIPKLKVSDKPLKQVSHSKIPIFKDKLAKGKIKVQCENTPPKMQPKQSQWSTEDSLII